MCAKECVSVCVCVYVCVCVCVRAHTHTHVWVGVGGCVPELLRASEPASSCVKRYIRISRSLSACKCVCVSVCLGEEMNLSIRMEAKLVFHTERHSLKEREREQRSGKELFRQRAPKSASANKGEKERRAKGKRGKGKRGKGQGRVLDLG